MGKFDDRTIPNMEVAPDKAFRMSKKEDLIGLAILSCTDALAVLDKALGSENLESTREPIERAKRHLLILRTQAAHLLSAEERKPADIFSDLDPRN